MPVSNAKCLDPDQTPRSAASDLDHCLPVSLLWDAMHKWIKLSTTEEVWVRNRVNSTINMS